VIGWAVRQLVIWGGIGLLTYALVTHGLQLSSLQMPPSPVLTKTTPPASAAVGSAVTNSLVYRADSRGHVVVEGDVNGSAVRFLVDTGATLVALTTRDASAAGFSRNDLSFNSRVSTANGVARVAPVTLRELRIGQFSVRDVPAAVVEDLNISLLGQSFLKRLESYEMRDGVLTLNWN
jgi:aspartyl protease family protein